MQEDSDFWANDHTVTSLRAICKTNGLDHAGTKAVIVARLQAGGIADPASSKAAAAAAAPAADEEQPAKRKRTTKAAEPEPAPAAAAPAKRGKKAAPKQEEAAEEPAPKAPAPKAAAAKKGKAAKAEAAPEPASKSDAMAKLKGKTSGKLRPNAAVDSGVPGASTYKVYSNSEETFDAMLNQTNIGQNNNKFYVIQILTRGGAFYTWNRWGRVGEPGQNKLGYASEAEAISDFKKKFKDKTSNHWDNRGDFQKVPGKYDLVDMDDGAEEEEVKTVKAPTASGAVVKVKPCTLDAPTQSLVKLLFDHDMFREAMSKMEIDVSKMPLGKISKAQIAKGYEVLEEMKDIIISNKNTAKLNDLSSKFYTIVPHSFGRMVPPAIKTIEMLQQKMDMLEMLGDIDLALNLQKPSEEGLDEVPHPIDQNYLSLHCGLRLVDRSSVEFKAIMTFLNATMEHRKLDLLEIWSVDREHEGDRFKAHDDIKERKLLWHGTNVAVVAAILKTGLRIMPHSGGRVGRGIYFASENSKSSSYVRSVSDKGVNTGIMFLAEVALGKQHEIKMDDYRLTAAPKGYDSIVAKGSGEPDPSKDTTITLDGHPVVVPQGKRIPTPAFSDSNFDKSEYLIYKESQHRLRYLLKLKF